MVKADALGLQEWCSQHEQYVQSQLIHMLALGVQGCYYTLSCEASCILGEECLEV